MVPSRLSTITISVTLASLWSATIWTTTPAQAQRLYYGSSPTDSQYFGATRADVNGRVTDADGRSVDPFGNYVDDYGWKSAYYRTPNRGPNGYPTAGASSYPRGTQYYGYTQGGYGGMSYTSGMGYSVGLGAYSGGFDAINSQTASSGPGVGQTYLMPPRTVTVGGVIPPSRTVMNNQTRGMVIEYTHNGNGYIAEPGSTYQTVISSGPSIFPSVTVLQPTQPPVVIDSKPTQTVAKVFPGSSKSPRSNQPAADPNKEVRLIYPKEAALPMSYVLNGTAYSIKPGYTHTITADRIWTIEFLRGGNGTQPMRYELTAGTYYFVLDQVGWDLKYPISSSTDLPALNTTVTPQQPIRAPLQPVPAPTPSPDL